MAESNGEYSREAFHEQLAAETPDYSPPTERVVRIDNKPVVCKEFGSAFYPGNLQIEGYASKRGVGPIPIKELEVLYKKLKKRFDGYGLLIPISALKGAKTGFAGVVGDDSAFNEWLSGAGS